MISYVLFTLSGLCFAAMFTPAKQPTRQVYTYYVGDDEPMPTWKRKVAASPRVAERVGC